MSSENQTNIRFSLKETVWFQKGQEVKEVRSLSLNPDITIQQFEEYVQVKGVLTLEGNYLPEVDNGDFYSLRELAPSRFVEDVRALEDGSCNLHHPFPVDISIPLTRISDLENLCVSVETFDYQITEKGCIQIAADLCISGLYDNRAVENYHQQRENEQYNAHPYENGYRNANDEPVGVEERDEEEQFQFFNNQTQVINTGEDNLYGSDWIQPLEEVNEQEQEEEEVEQSYANQPTYLEAFSPIQGEARDETIEEAVLEQVEEYEQYEQYEQEVEDEYNQENDYFASEVTNEDVALQEDNFTEATNVVQDYDHQENNQEGTYQQESYLNNQFNIQLDPTNYEEQYNRAVDQSYQQYFKDNQYQQPPYPYTQQPFFQNQYPQVTQPSFNVNDVRQPPSPSFNVSDVVQTPPPSIDVSDVRQTPPPLYAEYYQAQAELENEPVTNQAEDDVQNEVEVNRSTRSDNLLSSFFSGSGREESYSKLKLYLAQNGDTVDSVAKKYNVPVQQLNRVNNLNDEFLSEGQIIYIPVSAIKQQH